MQLNSFEIADKIEAATRKRHEKEAPLVEVLLGSDETTHGFNSRDHHLFFANGRLHAYQNQAGHKDEEIQKILSMNKPVTAIVSVGNDLIYEGSLTGLGYRLPENPLHTIPNRSTIKVARECNTLNIEGIVKSELPGGHVKPAHVWKTFQLDLHRLVKCTINDGDEAEFGAFKYTPLSDDPNKFRVSFIHYENGEPMAGGGGAVFTADTQKIREEIEFYLKLSKKN